MRVLEDTFGQKPWWGLLKHSHRDLAAKERLFDSSSINDTSREELLQECILQPSERRRIRIRNHICWLTAVNSLMLGVTVVLNSLSRLPWSTADMETCVKATSFYCTFFILNIVLCYRH